MTRSGDRGNSLVEVVLTMSLVVAVMAVLFGLFDAFTRSEHRHETTLDVRQELRQAMGEINRDLRGATAVLAPASGVAAATSLELAITTSGGVASMVRLRLDATSRTLVREVITTPGGAAQATRLLLRNVPATTSPTFRYFSPSGAELDPLALQPVALVACTSRVRVDLHASATGGPADATQSLQIAPRNLRPEEIAC